MIQSASSFFAYKVRNMGFPTSFLIIYVKNFIYMRNGFFISDMGFFTSLLHLII
ncbi:hypothetical protein C1646_728690 [Rhizophagus diaphanus]|nr:hypothetical protein C1646_728690 [Rhizophagus diaphanus] [Rhizophagus sp. MUCL 43196]